MAARQSLPRRRDACRPLPAATDAGITRRRFLAVALAAALTASCDTFTEETPVSPHRMGRLTSRPHVPAMSTTAGVHRLGLVEGRDGLLFVPDAYRPERPAPLVVMLHGAGGSAQGVAHLFSLAGASGALMLAPDSRGRTWDLSLGFVGPDVTYLDVALAYTFDHVAVDPACLVLAGFSDGASYALSIGLANGDLFGRLAAFSPGYLALQSVIGAPRIFVAHGTQDTVLPIDTCGRPIVRQLQDWGYDVRFRAFDGPHTIPSDVAREAMAWMVG